MLLSIDRATEKWMIKTLVNEHTCTWCLSNKRLTYRVLGNNLIEKMGNICMKMDVKDFKYLASKEYDLQITPWVAQHTKKYVTQVLSKNIKEEFRWVADYAAELKHKNPSARCAQ